MAREFPVPDEAYKKKKVVVVLCAVLLILLCMALGIGYRGGLIGIATPSPTAIAVVTTPPPATTAQPTATPTQTPLPSLIVTPTPVPTDTASPPTATTRPSTPTSPPSPTLAPPTPTPTVTPTAPPRSLTPTVPPSATPVPPTPTPSLSPTPTPTPTPTVTPTAPRPPVIQNPADGSELPGEELKVDGTAQPGTTVEVYTDDTSLGKALADESGNWSLVPDERLPAGDHTIVAVDTGTNQTSLPVTFTLVETLLPVTGADK